MMDKASVGSEAVANTAVVSARIARQRRQAALPTSTVRRPMCAMTRGVLEGARDWEPEVQSWSKYCLCRLNIPQGKASLSPLRASFSTPRT